MFECLCKDCSKTLFLTKSKPYVIVFEDDSCNMDAGIIDTFCDNLANKMDAKKIIYTSSDISMIQKYVSENEDTNINQSLRDFITKVETTPVQNKGRLFAEFNNGTYATIVMDNSVTIPDDPITPPTSVKVGGQEVEIVESGDGLYEDDYENGRYVYKGANPNNYIEFDNGEIWRIISKEADGTYKILKNEVLSGQAWDSTNSNNWARPADLNTYLNGEYYNGLDSSIKDNIVSHTWGIGAVSSNNDLAVQIASEQGTTWNGNVGLIANSDYLRANSDMVNCGTHETTNTNYKTCRNTDWMYISGRSWWTISPSAGSSRQVWDFLDVGSLSYNNASTSFYAPRPAAYLKSDITLSGSGTSLDPYKIVS